MERSPVVRSGHGTWPTTAMACTVLSETADTCDSVPHCLPYSAHQFCDVLLSSGLFDGISLRKNITLEILTYVTEVNGTGVFRSALLI